MSLTIYFTTTQISCLQAAVRRIIPADDYPDGWDAGGEGYFTHLLTLEPRFLLPYQQGLDALDAEARAASGQAFSEMEPLAQDQVMRKVEAGEVQTEWPLDPGAFFWRLVEQTMEGFYADPGNGGNKDGVGWQMIGYTVTA